MKRLLIALSIAFACSLVWAGQHTVVVVQPAGTPAPTYLVNQGFEGTGYDNSESWTENGAGTIDEDSTSTVLAGSQSLNITTSAASGNTYITISSQSEIWVYMLFNCVSTSTTSDRILTVLDGATGVASLSRNTSGTLSVAFDGAFVATTVGTQSTSTSYHIWFHYKAGSGTAEVDVGFSTDGTRPVSGNNYAGVTNGTMTSSVTRVRLGTAGSATHEHVFDHVLADDVAIGNSP